DYRDQPDDWPGRHVTMGATLFRRSALNLIRFRWEPGRCECQCCCDDLRRHALGIKYAQGVRARHHRVRPAGGGNAGVVFADEETRRRGVKEKSLRTAGRKFLLVSLSPRLLVCVPARLVRLQRATSWWPSTGVIWGSSAVNFWPRCAAREIASACSSPVTDFTQANNRWSGGSPEFPSGRFGNPQNCRR